MIFLIIKNGLFRKDINNFERLNTIKKYTGNLKKENEMEIEAMIGSNEWYKQIGLEEGRLEEKEENKKIILNNLLSLGLSEKEAKKVVELLLLD